MFFVFFFQAEDGIRDLYVTGVQTCALPICPEGKRTPEDTARVALETLVEGYLQTGSAEDCRRAIAINVEGAALPLGVDSTRALRRRAATLAEEKLGDRALAIDIRRVLADEQPGEPETIEALAKLYAADDRLVDLSELRRRQ